jgi:hypothetical protein
MRPKSSAPVRPSRDQALGLNVSGTLFARADEVVG